MQPKTKYLKIIYRKQVSSLSINVYQTTEPSKGEYFPYYAGLASQLHPRYF